MRGGELESFFSAFLSLNPQHYAIWISVDLYYSLKPGSMILPALFFLRIAVCGQFVVPHKFWDYLFQSFENITGTFIEIALNL